MADIIKVSMLAICGVMIALQFRTKNPEYALYIGFAVGILIFSFVLNKLAAVMSQFEQIRSYLGESEEYLAVLLKVLGITYICEFAAGICKDAGMNTVADQMEILGKLSVLFCGLPILFAVIAQIRQMGG